MEFCPDCESMLRLHKEKGKSVLKCRCGYQKEIGKQEKLKKPSQQTISANNSGKGEIEIIDDNIEALPTKTEECPKCGNLKAAYWQVQTRSGDESMTTFFRCTKCRYTWREY